MERERVDRWMGRPGVGTVPTWRCRKPPDFGFRVSAQKGLVIG
jgi:hypothetical protein